MSAQNVTLISDTGYIYMYNTCNMLPYFKYPMISFIFFQSNALMKCLLKLIFSSFCQNDNIGKPKPS